MRETQTLAQRSQSAGNKHFSLTSSMMKISDLMLYHTDVPTEQTPERKKEKLNSLCIIIKHKAQDYGLVSQTNDLSVD